MLALPGQGTGVEIMPTTKMLKVHKEFLKRSELSGLAENFSWTVTGTETGSSTHGICKNVKECKKQIKQELIRLGANFEQERRKYKI